MDLIIITIYMTAVSLVLWNEYWKRLTLFLDKRDKLYLESLRKNKDYKLQK